MTRALLRLAIVAAVIATAEAPVDRYRFGYQEGSPRNCLWCGHPLRSGRVYFDTDKCGRLWAEQYAARGYRLTAAEVVDVTGDVRPHPP